MTCPRHFEEDTLQEIESIFERLGLDEPIVTVTKMSGILTVRTDHDPVGVIRRISGMIEEEPWLIRYSQRIIPVQRTTICGIQEIVDEVMKIRSSIIEGQTYRITVEKRHSDISSKELIAKIAGVIPNRVSLEDPDLIILVEILGHEAGVSIIKRDDILSTEIKKRSLSEED